MTLRSHLKYTIPMVTWLLLTWSFLSDVSMALAAPGGSMHYYISPAGDDANPGTKESPFGTVQRAQEAVRRLKYTDQYPGNGVTVYLYGGRYELEEPIWLTPVDSGKPDAPVIYAALPGEQPRFSGGVLITGWEEVEKGLWKAPAQGFFRQLYVNGRRAIRARSPNGRREFHRLLSWDRENQTVAVPVEAVGSLENPAGAEFFVQTQWSQTILRIQTLEIEKDQAVITFHNPERLLIFNRPNPWIEDHQPFHIENHRSLLDAPGEWYHDHEEGFLYYRPLANEKLGQTEVIAPKIETLLRIEGSVNQPIEHVVFRDLTFEDSHWIRPCRIGLQGIQGGMFSLFASPDNIQIVGRPKAAVDVSGAREIRFERNVFRRLGATGLDLRHATHSCEVEGNVFKDIAGSAIRHGMFSPPDHDHHFVFQPEKMAEVCTNDTIRNNFITRVAADYLGNCGIACGLVRDVDISHNLIVDLPYTGISVGWGWSDQIKVMRNNRILHNRIDRVMNLLYDGGAIYTLSPQANSEIAYNYLSNISQSKWAKVNAVQGIYFDEETAHYHRHHNVMVNVFPPYERNQERTKNNRREDDMDLVVTSEEALPEKARSIVEQAGLEPEYQDIQNKE